MLISKNLTDIQSFYAGSNVFITGASGFLGMLLLEKLLRSCRDVKKIYLLMREKKGQLPAQRLEAIKNDELFQGVLKKHPDCFEKITLITGDCEISNLDLSEENVEILINEIDCVFHVAATVKFNETIRKAAYINVRGTKDVLELSKKMKKLKVFVYVSTAYSNCPLDKIDEKIYESPITSEHLLQIVDLLSEEQLYQLTPYLLQKWPNTYSFSKCVAENLLKKAAYKFPITIIRPSIVIGTAREPLLGWINNMYGPTGVSCGVGIGLLHTIRCNSEMRSDVIPADYVISTIIAAAWNVGSKSRINNQCISNDNNITVFNCVSGPEKPITWGEFYNLSFNFYDKLGSVKQIWYDYFFFTSHDVTYHLAVIFCHLIPAYIVDVVAVIIGKNPIMVTAYQKIDKYLDVLTYFATREWDFNNKNTQKLWTTMNSEDKRLFQFSMTLHEWSTYFYNYTIGQRVYLVKDPLETIPKARRKRILFKIAHYSIITFFLILLFLLCLLFIRLFH